MTTSDDRLRDALEELELTRRGIPYHYHVDVVTGDRTRCSSPYCVDLTPAGIRKEPQRA